MKEIRELADAVLAGRAPDMERRLARFALAVLDARDARDRHLGQCQHEAETTRQTEAYDEAEYQMTELWADAERRMKEGK